MLVVYTLRYPIVASKDRSLHDGRTGRRASITCFVFIVRLTAQPCVTSAVKVGSSLGRVEEFLLSGLAPATRTLYGGLIRGFDEMTLTEMGTGTHDMSETSLDHALADRVVEFFEHQARPSRPVECHHVGGGIRKIRGMAIKLHGMSLRCGG